MKRSLGQKIRLAWVLREPDGILPFVLIGTALVLGALFWLSMTAPPPAKSIGTVDGRVEAFAIHLGKNSRVGYLRAFAEGRNWYFVLPVNSDCREGDIILLSKTVRRRQGYVLTPASPQPCRRPTPFSQQ